MRQRAGGIDGRRWLALSLKELRQIRRDRRLMISLLVPPTLQIVLFGFALSAQVSDLRLGVVDESHTPESRELVSSLTTSRAFRLSETLPSPAAIEEALLAGRLDAGLVIPWDFARSGSRYRPESVQFLLDAVNANTAEIAQSYAEQAIASLNQQRSLGTPTTVSSPPLAAPGGAAAPGLAPRGSTVRTRIAFLYNPGLETAWFIVTGIFGVLLILNGSLVASATMIREKDTGTLEALLMTPASALEMIVAKMAPLFLLLMMSATLVLIVGHTVFHLPMRGSIALVMTGAAFCILCGIGLGTLIATLARTANQAQLMGFFVNPPLATLSGALTPIEAMPKWIQPLTLLNPVRHFAVLARSVLVKGSGIDVVYVQLLALLAFAIVIVGLSAWRFRRQLSL